MKTLTHLFTCALVTVLFTLNAFGSATSPYPTSSLADQTVTVVTQVCNPHNHAAQATGLTALPTLLTNLEALDNTTTASIFELVGIRTYLSALRIADTYTNNYAKRIDAIIVSLNTIIAYKKAQGFQ